MCTALSLFCNGLYFGRTLDICEDYKERIVVTPRRFPLSFLHTKVSIPHYSFIGSAVTANGSALYFDAMNETGLCAAALAFRESAVYRPIKKDSLNIASFETIPYILSSFSSVREMLDGLGNLNITNDQFSKELPPSPLHFIVSDENCSAVIESTSNGVKIFENPIGVLTNEPPFDLQLSNLYSHPLVKKKDNNSAFCKESLYLDGDIENADFSGNFSSVSRFVRASLEKLAAEAHIKEITGESALFSILSSVSLLRGYKRITDSGKIYRTVYASCCSSRHGAYSIMREGENSVRSIKLSDCDQDSSDLITAF